MEMLVSSSDLPPHKVPGPKFVNVTCTPKFAPYLVLLGEPHTLSSQLEGLFISLYYISRVRGRMSGHGIIRDGVLTDWAKLRLYQVGDDDDD